MEAEPQLQDSPDIDCIEQVKIALMNSAIPLDSEIEHDLRWGYGAVNGPNWLDEIRDATLC